MNRFSVNIEHEPLQSIVTCHGSKIYLAEQNDVLLQLIEDIRAFIIKDVCDVCDIDASHPLITQLQNAQIVLTNIEWDFVRINTDFPHHNISFQATMVLNHA